MLGAERIIDANLNRAREAARVLEDIARFALNNPGLCASLKDLRHGLREATSLLPFDRVKMLAHRDTPGDVGTAISTALEMRRNGLADVAVAGTARLSESLRSLEEACKTFSAGAAGAFEALRYRAYTIEKELVLALSVRTRRQWRLCVLVTAALCQPHPWERVVELAIDGGADCVQLREKDLPDREILRMGVALVALAHPRHVSVIVNDRVDVAVLSGADGVHVGQDDLGPEHVRKITGNTLLVGVSTSNLDQARRAAREGADYCGVGPMFTTATKHKPEISGPPYLREYLADPATRDLPHLAIGGITPENAGALAGAGCRGVAVSSAVCRADDPAGVCRRLLGEIGAARAVPA